MRVILLRYGAWLAALLIVGVCLAGGWAIAAGVELPSDDEFNVLRWELRHVPGRWLYLTGGVLLGRPSTDEERERLGSYLLLTAQMDDLGGEPGAARDIERLRGERDRLENDVEATIEGWLTQAIEEVGLQSSLPFFPDLRWVFPPVDIELDPTPRALIVSPRDRIELFEQRPMRPDLGAEEIAEIEASIEADGNRAALVDDLAGMATYPSVVRPRPDYELLVETVAHEWVHNYLAFKPLGIRYLDSVELRTLNETVADLVGKELAARVVERHPLRPSDAERLDGVRPSIPSVDVDTVLRKLRLDVDELLAAGNVEEAESLMEQRRLELAQDGVVYRRINQAFFAFRGLYATEPGSIDPLGEKLLLLRQRTESIGTFLREAARLTSERDLDDLLSDAGR